MTNHPPSFIAEIIVTFVCLIAGIHMLVYPVVWVRHNLMLMKWVPDADKGDMFPVRFSAILLLLFSFWNAHGIYKSLR